VVVVVVVVVRGQFPEVDMAGHLRVDRESSAVDAAAHVHEHGTALAKAKKKSRFSP